MCMICGDAANTHTYTSRNMYVYVRMYIRARCSTQTHTHVYTQKHTHTYVLPAILLVGLVRDVASAQYVPVYVYVCEVSVSVYMLDI